MFCACSAVSMAVSGARETRRARKKREMESRMPHTQRHGKGGERGGCGVLGLGLKNCAARRGQGAGRISGDLDGGCRLASMLRHVATCCRIQHTCRLLSYTGLSLLVAAEAAARGGNAICKQPGRSNDLHRQSLSRSPGRMACSTWHDTAGAHTHTHTHTQDLKVV